MSYYYSYYIGYELDGKIYPWGPYATDGKLKSVLTRSRSFASNLYERFDRIAPDQCSDELKAAFKYDFELDDDEPDVWYNMHYLPASELPCGSAIRRGYFLIDDVEAYERMLKDNEDTYFFDGFYDSLSPLTYAARILHDSNHECKYDPDDEDSRHPATDYMFYAYEDKTSVEYEANFIKKVCDLLTDYDCLPKGAVPVIIEDEG